MRVSALIGAILVAAAAPAAAADTLCLDRSFDSDEQAVVDRFASKFDLQTWMTGSAPAELSSVLLKRVSDCAAELNWSNETTQFASRYIVVRYVAYGMEANSPLGRPQARRLSQAFDEANHARLLALFGRDIDPSLAQPGLRPRQEDIDYLGQLVVEAGISATADNAPFIRDFAIIKMSCVYLAQQLAAH